MQKPFFFFLQTALTLVLLFNPERIRGNQGLVTEHWSILIVTSCLLKIALKKIAFLSVPFNTRCTNCKKRCNWHSIKLKPTSNGGT